MLYSKIGLDKKINFNKIKVETKVTVDNSEKTIKYPEISKRQ